MADEKKTAGVMDKFKAWVATNPVTAAAVFAGLGAALTYFALKFLKKIK